MTTNYQPPINNSFRLLRLYDRTRKPPDWTSHLAPNQVAVFLRDRKFGTTLSPEGAPITAASEMSCLVFDSMDDAKNYCERRVAELPNLQCEVYDSRGKAVPPLATFPPASERGGKMSPRKVRLMLLIALLLMLPTPWLIYIDWRSRGMLLFPTFFAINLFFVALRLVLWVLQSPK